MTTAMVQLSVPLGQFLRWWSGELRACLPGYRTSPLAALSRALIVRLRPDQAVFEHLKGRRRREIGRIAFEGSDGAALKRQVATIRRKAGVSRSDVVLCLPSDCVLECQVNLPIAARENLQEVLGFEMERFTAFKTDEVYYAYRLVDVDQMEKRIAVELRVTPRTIAEEAIKRVGDWGLKVDVVTADSDEPMIEHTANLLPKTVGSRLGRGFRRLLSALLVLAACLAAVAVLLEFKHQKRLLDVFEASLAERHAASVHAEELRKRVDQLLDRSQYVARRKQSRPLFVEILDETTRLLPDDTWVAKFRLQDDQLTLSGYSAGASTLIEALEASPLLSQVRFASPVTLDAKQGIERFNLSARVVADGAPP